MKIAAVYQAVTRSIIAELEQRAAPWVKPWKGGARAGIMSGCGAVSRTAAAFFDQRALAIVTPRIKRKIYHAPHRATARKPTHEAFADRNAVAEAPDRGLGGAGAPLAAQSVRAPEWRRPMRRPSRWRRPMRRPARRQWSMRPPSRRLPCLRRPSRNRMAVWRPTDCSRGTTWLDDRPTVRVSAHHSRRTRLRLDDPSAMWLPTADSSRRARLPHDDLSAVWLPTADRSWRTRLPHVDRPAMWLPTADRS